MNARNNFAESKIATDDTKVYSGLYTLLIKAGMAMAEDGRGLNRGAGSELWFGEYQELGKTEARQSFLRLLDGLESERTTFTITDRGEKVAVIMGYKQYLTLLHLVQKQQSAGAEKKNPFEGLICRVGDLDQSKQRVNELFQKSIKKTRQKL